MSDRTVTACRIHDLGAILDLAGDIAVCGISEGDAFAVAGAAVAGRDVGPMLRRIESRGMVEGASSARMALRIVEVWRGQVSTLYAEAGE